MIQTVYKVVEIDFDRNLLEKQLVSPCRLLLGGWDVVYKQGVRTFPKLRTSYLYAYADFKASTLFLSGRSNELQLWEARAEVLPVRAVSSTCGTIDQFWNNQEYAMDYPIKYLWNMPETSVWCEWIELVKKLRV